jgi:tRNA G18 (ribose-2'-O)-methylase SpoU
MGYFEVGVLNLRNRQNLGTLWRTAVQLGAAGIFTIGRPYKPQTSDVFQTMQDVPLRHFATFEEFLANRPVGAELVGVEMGGVPLREFIHPARAVYLLGSEDMGLPPRVLAACNHLVSLQSVGRESYNLAVTGSIVLYHRVFLAP